jgi:hypothetical protein
MSAVAPSDFALHAGSNPAQSAAADGSDAGMHIALLPRIGAPQVAPHNSAVEPSGIKTVDPQR